MRWLIYAFAVAALACGKEETTAAPAETPPETPAMNEPAPPAPAQPMERATPVEPATPQTAIDEALMVQVRALIKRGDFESLRPYLGENDEVEVQTTNSVSDEQTPQRQTLAGARAFSEWLATQLTHWGAAACGENATEDSTCHWYNGLHILSRATCADNCCRHDHDGLLHNTLFLDAVCFEPREGAPPRIRSIEFTDGG